ncbi:MAG: excinuclease ABC subunit UvrC [Clostridia bacterium]|nr:excinuclease ABC subunit UvrC [Clostridia bacterium]
MQEIDQKLKHLPESPGVYVMLDKDGQIIYVGKAKNLKNRVRQYFFNRAKTLKVSTMVSNIADFYYIIVPTEIDALSLENNLIKKHKPRYNVLLKDDKTYPYLRVDLKDSFPTFKVTRKIKKDGAKYFGPYMGGINVNGILQTLNLAFGIRPCDKNLNPEKQQKPCLNYHLKKCSAPCNGQIDKSKYRERINDAVAFLSGDTMETEKLLTQKMLTASQNEDFELALKYKEIINSLEKIALKRITSLNKFVNADVLAYATNGIYSAINLLVVRNGRMLGGKNFAIDTGIQESGEALRQFVMRYYAENVEIPDEIITEEQIADDQLLQEYFKTTHLKSVNFTHAKQGVKKQLSQMATVNAKEYLDVNLDKIKHKEDMTITACKALQQKLNLKRYPKRMECYDISNISGVDKVGSMVVFVDGQSERSSYRRFKIKTVQGADDYKSHQEMMRRRLDRLLEKDQKFPKPDLMVIDGGKGQLSAVMQVINEYNITDIDVIALAEREEEIYLVGQSQPVVLSKRDYCLKMLQRLRDEAHRFAITYHRTLRGKRALSSVLDGVVGLGKVKRTALMEKFKDISGIAKASIEELKSVQGIGEKQAQLIIEKLTQEGLR